MTPERYFPKKISEVRESDSRVALMGNVVSIADTGFVIEDQSGRTEITSGYPVKEGDLVRVFCTVNGKNMKADAVQSLNGLDVKLYQKAEELYRKARI